MQSIQSVALVMIAALLLDQMVGEPTRWHPLVGFGRIAEKVERKLYGVKRWRGALALGVAVTPVVMFCWWFLWWFSEVPWIKTIVEILMVYLALGGRSLFDHGMAVYASLQQRDWMLARQKTSALVSRDTETLNPDEMARATVESILENGCDAVFGAMFWFLALGAPGVLLYRMVNTLDAMWGYRNDRYQAFGWAAARLDDLLNFIPARLTALSYCLAGGRMHSAWRAWRAMPIQKKSPNATLVMAIGAGVLGVRLGGATLYHQTMQNNPVVGEVSSPSPEIADIPRAAQLVRRSSWLWGGVALLSLWC